MAIAFVSISHFFGGGELKFDRQRVFPILYITWKLKETYTYLYSYYVYNQLQNMEPSLST